MEDWLICPDCRTTENPPFDIGDKCVCGGKFVEQFIPFAEQSPLVKWEVLRDIINKLQGAVNKRKEKHDTADWPHKFLYAHEGIGLIKAIEIIFVELQKACEHKDKDNDFDSSVEYWCLVDDCEECTQETCPAIKEATK